MSIVKTPLTVDADNNPLRSIDAKSIADSARRFKTGGYSTFSVQITLKTKSGSGTFSLWSVKRSLDGIDWMEFDTPITLQVIDGSVRTMDGGLSIPDVPWIQIAPATASTYTTEIVDIAVLGVDWT